MKKLLMTVAAMAMLATGAHAETSVLRSLPTEVPNEIRDVRASLFREARITSGDEGLKRSRVPQERSSTRGVRRGRAMERDRIHLRSGRR